MTDFLNMTIGDKLMYDVIVGIAIVVVFFAYLYISDLKDKECGKDESIEDIIAEMDTCEGIIAEMDACTTDACASSLFTNLVPTIDGSDAESLMSDIEESGDRVLRTKTYTNFTAYFYRSSNRFYMAVFDKASGQTVKTLVDLFVMDDVISLTTTDVLVGSISDNDKLLIELMVSTDDVSNLKIGETGIEKV